MSDEIIVLDEEGNEISNRLWDQLPDESDVEYTKFLTYANLSPASRSMNAAWLVYTEGKMSQTPSGAWEALCSRNQWVRRSQARDVHMMSERVDKDNWIIRDARRRNIDYGIGDRMKELALKKLEDLDPSQISITQAIKLAQVGSGLQSTAVPSLNMSKGQIKNLLDSLPEAKKGEVVRLLMVERKGS